MIKIRQNCSVPTAQTITFDPENLFEFECIREQNVQLFKGGFTLRKHERKRT